MLHPFRHGREGGPRQGSAFAVLIVAPRDISRPVFDFTRCVVEQVEPLRIHGLYEPNLPGTLPLLDLTFPPDRLFHRVVELKVDKLLHAVLLRETLKQPLFVVGNAAVNVAGHADVQYPVRLAGEDVNAGLFFFGRPHDKLYAARDANVPLNACPLELVVGGRLRGHDDLVGRVAASARRGSVPHAVFDGNRAWERGGVADR